MPQMMEMEAYNPDRRHFLKLMSASMLLAGMGLTGCRRPEERIVPFTSMPENYIHGAPQYFATSFSLRGSSIPLVVKSHDGRPIKIEGNPLHPDFAGVTDHFAQASLLNLYDPDRAVRYLEKGRVCARQRATAMLDELASKTAGNRGQGFCLLTERTTSPSSLRLIKELLIRYPEARWFMYEPVDYDIHRKAASIALQGQFNPFYALDAAKVLFSFDNDFLATDDNACLNIRNFSQARKRHRATDTGNRLYMVESLYSLTGANADHRVSVASSQIPAVAACLAIEIFTSTGKHSELVKALKPLADTVPSDIRSFIQSSALDLVSHGERSVCMAGYRQPLMVHLLVHAMNDALGSLGKTVLCYPEAGVAAGTLDELALRLRANTVETLVIVGGNPVYNAPAAMEWAQLQRLAKTTVRLGYYEDETADGCDWHFPMTHYLESWGDTLLPNGDMAPVQPLIAPLFDGLMELEFLARLAGVEERNARDVVRRTFETVAGKSQESWHEFLSKGFTTRTRLVPQNSKIDLPTLAKHINEFKASSAPLPDSLDVTFHPSHSTDDGRFNNNGWLQETPDLMTKICWENSVSISPKTAQDLGLSDVSFRVGDANNWNNATTSVVEVQLGQFKVQGPVLIQTGMADNTIGLALGYGRTRTGRVGMLPNGLPVGYNAYLAKPALESTAVGAKVSLVTRKSHEFAVTQLHSLGEGRNLIKELSDGQWPGAQQASNLNASHSQALHSQPPLTGKQQWAMVIDLTACVGCSTCMVACQSENNVPIVGKDQVAKGRTMNWVRLDRYYSHEGQTVRIAWQPVFCAHCENAPCEYVCPANATAHSQEGLNMMTYNRCVGTRYCANNCPYKTRRFNYFDYNRRELGKLYQGPFSRNPDGQWEAARWFKDPDKGNLPLEQWDVLSLLRNPDVTVRMRGVMEKCTYCVQRIEHARIAARIQSRSPKNASVSPFEADVPQTACQQACPAGAIIFGDMADSASPVSQLKQLGHNYSLLAHLNTKPRTTYLARLRNSKKNG